MKLGPVTKLDKKNKTTSKKNISVNCNVIVILLGAIRKPDSGYIVCKASEIVTFHLTKTENRTKKSLTQLSHYFFE